MKKGCMYWGKVHFGVNDLILNFGVGGATNCTLFAF